MLPRNDGEIWPGADEQTPSLAQYFSWINNTNEGSTEAQTLANLAFFRWLREEYGMRLDVYAWDAGNLDGPGDDYGIFESDTFRRQFPNGWEPIARAAAEMDCRLGIWGGPDGFGDTPEEEEARIERMVSLCRDLNFALFKFDTVCGHLRPEKRAAFARMMTECRRHAPDLILLNHRIGLEEAQAHATTFLWGGEETYIDVHMTNECTAPHHRAGALSRGLVPGLQRLTEDHGVCISSCIDFWDDDLVLQAFNRALILAPEIYGNPWLMRDDEFPKLARIYNLHRRFREILVHGQVLPEAAYGPWAVSRGDAATRLLTLRNLTWEETTVPVRLDEEIGLVPTSSAIELRRFHPDECVLGQFAYGDVVEVAVSPFRSCLLVASSVPIPELAAVGCDYAVVQDVPGKPVVLHLLGLPGERVSVRLQAGERSFGRAVLDGQERPELLSGGTIGVNFPGTPLREDWHRCLGELAPVPVPADAEALYEATCFAASNNALEVQSLERSGPTEIPAVAKARDAFFGQEFFQARGIWDHNLFDGRTDTFLSAWHRHFVDYRRHGGALRIDMGEAQTVDRLEFLSLHADGWDDGPKPSIPEPLVASVSADLKTWSPVTFRLGATELPAVDALRLEKNGGVVRDVKASVRQYVASVPAGCSVRYVRILRAPGRIAEFSASCSGVGFDRSGWRATSLFAPFAAAAPVAAWERTIEIGAPPAGSYLCVALEGTHGEEGAYAALRVNGKAIGSSDRAPAYPSNVWEAGYRRRDHHYTYYIPVTEEMRGATVDVVVLGMKDGQSDFTPRVWITCHPAPKRRRVLVLE